MGPDPASSRVETGVARRCASSLLGSNRRSSAFYHLAFTQLLTKAHTPQEKWNQLRTVVPKPGALATPSPKAETAVVPAGSQIPSGPMLQDPRPQSLPGQGLTVSLRLPPHTCSGQQSSPKGRLSPTHEQTPKEGSARHVNRPQKKTQSDTRTDCTVMLPPKDMPSRSR